MGPRSVNQRPYASAPVRSKPHRTYDPARPTRDPEGDYIPMYLANIHFQNKARWNALKDGLEKFGRTAGLFDEISVKPLGKKESEPFQVQVRKFGSRAKGPQRNLIDVGYGVSQVLPVITELLRRDAPTMFLLQQPEVHLHPSAQAALGSLFCQVAGPKRQLVIEKHSDHLLNRVRMDVRDTETKLKPEDVSILFFERGDFGRSKFIPYAWIKRETCWMRRMAIVSSLWKKRRGLSGRDETYKSMECAQSSMRTSPVKCLVPIHRQPEISSSVGLTKAATAWWLGASCLRNSRKGSPGFRDWASQAELSGKMRIVNEDEVGAITEQIEHEGIHASDDPPHSCFGAT